MRKLGYLFITLIVLGAFGIFFLHRIAGPVYRFRQVLRRLNENEVPKPIKLREGDFFTEVVSEFNRYLERIKFERDKSDLIREKIDELMAANPSGGAAQPAQELKAIVEKGPEERS